MKLGSSLRSQTGQAVLATVLATCLAACAGGEGLREASVTDVISGRVAFGPDWVERARQIDQAGERPINAILAYAPGLTEASAWRGQGMLGGVPVLIKDNIETRDMPTTAGSLALIANDNGRDAPVVARLREQGAVIMGKTNLSEWANIRSSQSISGWSAVGGLTRNPHDPARSACGSSAGSGAAVAAGLAPVAIGTETDGSIVCPAAVNGIVGFKPTVGLVSRTHIIPISHTQDTAGPMARSVEDVAIVLNVIAGSDPADPATRDADAHKTDYRAALDPRALAGKRIGIMRALTGYSGPLDQVFERQLDLLRQAGAELVEVADKPDASIGEGEISTLMTELKAGLNAYLASTDTAKVPVRTLADVISFNANTPRETVLFGQEMFERAQATEGLADPEYIRARDQSVLLAGSEGIDSLLRVYDVIALIAPTTGPAWLIDPVKGDDFAGGASQMAAVAGYPHLTVPMGQVEGLPVGMSFIGSKWDDAVILSLGYAYEQISRARVMPRMVTGQIADGGSKDAYRPHR